MSPIRYLTASTASPAPGAWSPLAMDVLRGMLDSPDSSNAGSDALIVSSPFPPTSALEPCWDTTSFFPPAGTSLDAFWEYPPSLTRSASPATSDNNSFTSMSVDELHSLLHDMEHKGRGNSLSDMDESAANAFFSHIAQQVQSVPAAELAASPVASNEDAEAELQYHLSTLKPNTVLAAAPEPLYDDHSPVGMDMPPRPPNAFILYRRHQQAHLRHERPGIHLHLASKLIATWWKNESAATKEYYRSLASEGRKELLKRYPDYKYRARTDSEKAIAKKKKQRKSTPSVDAVISTEHALYLQALSPYLCQ